MSKLCETCKRDHQGEKILRWREGESSVVYGAKRWRFCNGSGYIGTHESLRVYFGSQRNDVEPKDAA